MYSEMVSNGKGGEGRRTEKGKQMPLEVFHQKANEPYFMNAMEFYNLLCDSLKCLGPKPANESAHLNVFLQKC